MPVEIITIEDYHGAHLVRMSNDLWEKCEKFSKEVYSTTRAKYASRNQDKKDKIIEDHAIGKLGELAVYAYLTEIGYNVNPPDFEIYDGPRKSYAPDMVIDNQAIHVKSQTTAQGDKFGRSWTFQYSGRGYGDKDQEIFEHKRGIAAFCEVVDKNNVIIHGLVTVPDLHEHKLFHQPVASYLKGIKKVVYLDAVLDAGLLS